MNKRIIELAIESGLPTALDYHQKRYEKFAELIVKECAMLVDSLVQSGPVSEVQQRRNWAYMNCRDVILSRLGGEE